MKTKEVEKPIRQSRSSTDRRRIKDLWGRVFVFSCFWAWIVLVISLLIFHRAKPEFETFFDRFYHLELRTTWDYTQLTYLSYTMGTGFLVSLFAFGLSRARARRKTDHKNHLILLGVLYLFLIFLTWFCS